MSLDHHVGQRMGPGPKPSEIRALSLLQIIRGKCHSTYTVFVRYLTRYDLDFDAHQLSGNGKLS